MFKQLSISYNQNKQTHTNYLNSKQNSKFHWFIILNITKINIYAYIEKKAYMRSLIFIRVVNLGPLAISLSDFFIGSLR